MPTPETERLEALRRYAILDTPPDGCFDHLTQLAATLFNMPIAIISLVDEDRIWFKSKVGVTTSQVERVPGLCASAILSPELYVVEDALLDARTLANPLVAGNLGLRFYAAAPLITRDGHALGTFCLIDKKQRYLTDGQREVLQRLAGIVMDEIELRLSARNLLNTVYSDLQHAARQLEELPNELRDPRLESTLAASRKLVQTLEKQLDCSVPETAR